MKRIHKRKLFLERRRFYKEKRKINQNKKIKETNKEVETLKIIKSKKISKQEYKNHHYVPIWYQKRFLPENQANQELYLLDLNPGKFTDSRGVQHDKKALHRLGFKFCFCEEDLYTINFGSMESREVEKYFFGRIDRNGRHAVNRFSNYDHKEMAHDFFNDMMVFMSTQKLRTPKGLNWLSCKIKTSDRTHVIKALIKLRNLYSAIWTECVWQIADASSADTKFILSDHPVTVYNRVCGPRSTYCRGNNDPGVWLNGTHTIFPLSIDKILILTNLSWVRNPYQSPTSLRPNPNPFHSTIFKFTDIQVMRKLTEQEVHEINYIIKRRANKYIAAAKEEWLYPERKISSTDWSSYGHGYLFMPDPRAIHIGGQIYIGHNDGTSSAYDEYGRPGWHPDFARESEEHLETNTLHKFQGEFARLFGPYRRGRSFNFMDLDEEKDDDEFHKYHLELEKKYRY